MKSRAVNRTGIALLLVMIAVTPTLVTAHTFEWGVEVGEEFTYALQRKVLDPAFVTIMPYWMNFVIPIEAGTKFIATIMELEEIPTTITLSDTLPFSHASLTLENDSSNLLTDTTAFAILIGDWEYQGEFLNFSLEFPERTITDSDTEWGAAEYSSLIYDGRLYDYYYEWRYEKAQGTLVYARYRVMTLGTDLIDIIVSQWEEGDPTEIPPEIQPASVLMFAIGGAIAVIVAFIVYKWVKKPKGLAAELGK